MVISFKSEVRAGRERERVGEERGTRRGDGGDVLGINRGGCVEVEVGKRRTNERCETQAALLF